MPKPKHLLLALVSIFLLSLILWLEQRENREVENAFAEIPVKSAAIVEVKITRPHPNDPKSVEIIEFKKMDHLWRNTDPKTAAHGTDGPYLQQIIDRVSSLRLKNIGVSHSIGQFGFDAHFSIELKEISNTLTLHIGEIRNFEGQAYFKINQGPEVYLGDPTLANDLSKPRIYFENKRALGLPTDQISKVSITTAHGTFSLSRSNEGWSFPGSRGIVLSKTSLKGLFVKLGELTIQENLTYAAGALSGQIVSLRIATPEAEQTLRFNFREPERRLLVESIPSGAPPRQFLVDMSSWAYFANLKEDVFVERADPFRFDRSRVAEIKINRGATSRVFRPLDAAYAPLLEKLHDFEAAGRFNNPESPMVDVTEVWLNDADARPLLKIKFGRSKDRLFLVTTESTAQIFTAPNSFNSSHVNQLLKDGT